MNDGWKLTVHGPVVVRRCCRDWPIAVLFPVGRCGYCGKVPR